MKSYFDILFLFDIYVINLIKTWNIINVFFFFLKKNLNINIHNFFNDYV